MLVNRKIIGTVAPMFGLPSVLTPFARSYAEMMVFSQQYLCGPDQAIHVAYPRHSFHTIARNEIAREALGEFLFMLDTDHAFAPDLLLRLYAAMRKYQADVVTGLYLMKQPPHTPALWRFRADGHDTWGGWRKGEVLEVDCAGAGCLLVKTSVFDRIRDELNEEPFSIQEFKGVIGEDFAFFRRLQKLNIKTICPTYIECHHLQVRPTRMWVDYDPETTDLPLGPPVPVKTRSAA